MAAGRFKEGFRPQNRGWILSGIRPCKQSLLCHGREIFLHARLLTHTLSHRSLTLSTQLVSFWEKKELLEIFTSKAFEWCCFYGFYSHLNECIRFATRSSRSTQLYFLQISHVYFVLRTYFGYGSHASDVHKQMKTAENYRENHFHLCSSHAEISKHIFSCIG